MVLDVEPEEIMDHIGHDGQAEVWPTLTGTDKLRGIHPQELIDYCWDYQYAVTRIEVMPMLAPNRYVDPVTVGTESYARDRVTKYMYGNDAVIVGVNSLNSRHAIAWCHKTKQYFDPNGLILKSPDLRFKELYIIKSFGGVS
jgi:hypothetical protein